MNSPEKSAKLVLGTLSEEDIKNFLTESANLPNPIDYPPYRSRFDRWLRRWQRFFTFKKEGEDGKWHAMEIPNEQLERFVPHVRTTLCRVWVEQDPRQRDWYIYRLRDGHHRMVVRAEHPDLLGITDRNAANRLLKLERLSQQQGGDEWQRLRLFQSEIGTELLEDVPRVSPFEAAMFWLQNNQRLMLRCGGPMCAAPYFFRTEKGQKYCSPECADPARREAKLRWWNEHRGKAAKRER